MLRPFWIVLFCFWAASAAQAPVAGFLGPSVRSLKLEDALPGAPAQVLLQTRQGVLWAGTGDGLALFSGVSWKLVPMGAEGRSYSVRALLEAQDGSLWVGTEQDGLWHFQAGRWEHYGVETGVPLATGVRTLLETRGASGQPILWIGTEQGVARREGGQWSNTAAPKSLAADRIWKLRELQEPNGSMRVWAATARGVARWVEGRWEAVPLGPAFGPSPHVNDVLSVPTSAGGREVWVSIWNIGLGSWDGTTWQRHGPQEGFPSRNPTGLAFARHGSRGVLWAGTYASGLAWFDGIWHRLSLADGFPSAFVLDLQATPGGKPALLVATKSAGILALDQGGWSPFVGRQGLPNEAVTCFAEELRPGRVPAMWLGTAQGIARWDGATGRMTTYTRELPSTFFQALMARPLPGGGLGLWAGTSLGLMTFDGGAWTLLGPRQGLPVASANRLAETRDAQGQATVWVGFSRGLAWLRDGRWTVDFAQGSLPPSGVTELLSARDPDGGNSLWVGTRNQGVRRCRNGAWTQYGAGSGLPTLGITSLQAYTDARGGAWILAGTSRGEVAYLTLDRPGALWQTLPKTASPTLADSTIYRIEVDLQNRLYILSQRGLARISLRPASGGLEPDQASTHTSGDGLPNANCTTSLRDALGRIWVATSTGVAVLDPAQETFEGPLPAPAIHQAQLLPGRIPIKEGAVLNYRQHRLLFEFTLPVHHRFEETRFRTELVGAEEPGPWERAAFREFSSLPSGRHTLRVWARNHDGAVSGPTEFNFRIASAPWATPWAIGLYALAFLGAGLLILKRVTRYLVRRNRILEAKVADRTRLLEVSNRALAEQSLRDPLTGLRNRRFVMEAMDRDVAKVHRDYKPGAGSPDPNRAMLFLMVDLDHFKAINDQHGHKAGDAVLVQAAAVLTRAMRETDSVVRWGGEEFVGIARGLNPAEATVLAERIRAEVEAHAFAISPDLILRVTCSVGFAAFPLFPDQAAALTWEQTIDLADECLYAAKHGGRNCWAGLLPRPGGEYHGPLALHARDFAQAGLAAWVEGPGPPAP